MFNVNNLSGVNEEGDASFPIEGLSELLGKFRFAGTLIKFNPEDMASIFLDNLRGLLFFDLDFNLFFKLENLNEKDLDKIQDKKKKIIEVLNHSYLIVFCKEQKQLAKILLEFLIVIYSFNAEREKWPDVDQAFESTLNQCLDFNHGVYVNSGLKIIRPRFNLAPSLFSFLPSIFNHIDEEEKDKGEVYKNRINNIQQKILLTLRSRECFAVSTSIGDNSFFYINKSRSFEENVGGFMNAYISATILAVKSISLLSLRLAYLERLIYFVNNIKVTITVNCISSDYTISNPEFFHENVSSLIKETQNSLFMAFLNQHEHKILNLSILSNLFGYNSVTAETLPKNEEEYDKSNNLPEKVEENQTNTAEISQSINSSLKTPDVTGESLNNLEINENPSSSIISSGLGYFPDKVDKKPREDSPIVLLDKPSLNVRKNINL